MDFAVYAPRLAVDNRLSLKFYIRIAESILKQANVYRRENNYFQLFVLLLRYASLVQETIPKHKQYRSLGVDDRSHLRKKLVEVVQELEFLKPKARAYLAHQLQGPPRLPSSKPFQQEQVRERSIVTRSTQHKLEDQSYTLSFTLPTPTKESLARHAYLSPFQNQRPADVPLRVGYPKLLDGAPASQNPSSLQPPPLQHLEQFEDVKPVEPSQDIKPLSQFDLLNQLLPPPVPAPIQTVPSQAAADKSDSDIYAPVQPKEPKQLYLSSKVMDEFLAVARANTLQNMETCGILAGSLEGGKFSVTTLIIPKQLSTANTCETVNEEEIFEVQDKHGLFQLGWIHTHPTQSCFMSSVDLHTHYSYQIMLQEAIAIVMAPQDLSRKYGIFRLSDPGGVNLIQKCSKRGFHAHEGTSDGSPIYEKCSHVLFDPYIKFEVMDLRN